MNENPGGGHYAHLLTAGLLGWALPGAGHFYIGERTRGAVIFVTIALTFLLGLWVGSIGRGGAEICGGGLKRHVIALPLSVLLAGPSRTSLPGCP